MIHEQIIIACLTAEKYGCDLPLGKWFTNHKIDEELRNEKLLLVNNFKSISSLENFLETLAYKFQMRLNCVINETIMISDNFEPDIFVRINKFEYIFHSDAEKGLYFLRVSIARKNNIQDKRLI